MRITGSVVIHDRAENTGMPVKEILFLRPPLPMPLGQVAQPRLGFRKQRGRDGFVTDSADVDDDFVAVVVVADRAHGRVVVRADVATHTHCVGPVW